MNISVRLIRLWGLRMSWIDVAVITFCIWELGCALWLFLRVWGQQWEKCGEPMFLGIAGVFGLLFVLVWYG